MQLFDFISYFLHITHGFLIPRYIVELGSALALVPELTERIKLLRDWHGVDSA